MQNGERCHNLLSVTEAANHNREKSNILSGRWFFEPESSLKDKLIGYGMQNEDSALCP